MENNEISLEQSGGILVKVIFKYYKMTGLMQLPVNQGKIT